MDRIPERDGFLRGGTVGKLGGRVLTTKYTNGTKGEREGFARRVGGNGGTLFTPTRRGFSPADRVAGVRGRGEVRIYANKRG